MVAEETIGRYSKVLVARYLRENGFTDALKAFSRECSLSFQEIADKKETCIESLEGIVAERIAYVNRNMEERLEKLAIEGRGELDSAISVHNAEFKVVEELSRKGSLAIRAQFCGIDDSLLVSYADRVIERFNGSWRLESHLDVSKEKFGAVKLCGTISNSDLFYLCGLDGSFVVYKDYSDSRSQLRCKLHQRMITHIQFYALETQNSWLVVSCGLDNYLCLHKLEVTAQGPQIQSMASEKLLSACSTLLVASHNKKPSVFVTRSEFTHVVCYGIEMDDYRLVENYRIALNNAEFGTFSFNVRDMIFIGEVDKSGTPIISKGSSLLVATSHVPYMRLIEVEIPLKALENTAIWYNQVLRNIPTEVYQDSFSEPVLKRMPKGREVLVGDSSGVYAVETLTGRTWLLELPTVVKGSRVKCMDLNREGTKLITAYSDKTVAAFDVVV